MYDMYMYEYMYNTEYRRIHTGGFTLGLYDYLYTRVMNIRNLICISLIDFDCLIPCT